MMFRKYIQYGEYKYYVSNGLFGKFFYFYLGKEKVGYVELYRPNVNNYATKRKHSLAIYLKPKMQHQGHGTNLMKFLFEYCLDRGINELSLGVEWTNINAIRLYEKCGFVKTNEHKNWFEMLKKL